MVTIKEKVSLAGIVTVDGEPYVLARNPETEEPAFTASLETDKTESQQEFREQATFGADGLGGSLPLVADQFHDALGVNPEGRGVLAADTRYEALGLGLTQRVTRLAAAMPTSGTSVATALAGTGATGAAGDGAWTNAANITAEDAAVASVSIDSEETSGELVATNFGLAPATNPQGIIVAVKTRRTGSAAVGATMSVQLQDDTGALVGPVRTKTIPETLSWVLFGGEDDAWGGVIDAAAVADADFGARITATMPDPSTAAAGTATSNTNTPAAVASSGADWTNVASAGSGDGVYATVALDGSGVADPLDLTVWNLTLPAGTTPSAIRLALTGYGTYTTTTAGGGGGNLILLYPGGTSTYALPVQITAQLLIGGSPVGDVIVLGTFGSTAPQVISGGGALSVWGLTAATVTEAAVEAATFGVRITATNTSSNAGTFSLDSGSIEVDYAGATTPGTGTVEVDAVRISTYTPGTSLILYAAAYNELVKLSAGTGSGVPVVSVEDTTAFTHGVDGAAAPITDLIILKDGDNPGNAAALIGFGAAAQLQQIDDITASGADTYHALAAAPAYAGVFGASMGAETTERRVWKSTGFDGQNDGHFSRLQNAPVLATDVDFTDEATWEPLSPYPVGDVGSDIKAIAEFQTGIVVTKPEGAYQFNDVGNSYFLFSTRSTRSEENGVALTAWEDGLLISTIRDLSRIPAEGGATWGISRLVSNLSPVGGFPTAVVTWGDYVYIAYYDGADSHILRGTRRTTQRVPHPLVFYPIRRLGSYRVDALAVCTDPTGTSWLFHPGPDENDTTKHDLYRTIIAPVPMRTYAASGYLETSLYGTTDLRTKLERVLIYCQNVGASLGRWRVLVSFDGGAYAVVGDWVETNGRTELVPVGITDEGYLYRFRLEFENDVATNRPLLLGIADEPGTPGGIAAEGKRLEEPAFRFEFLTTIAEHQRGPNGQRLAGSVAERANFLFERSREYVDIAAAEYPFSTVPLEVFVESVTMAMGEKDVPDARALKLRVKGRAKTGVRG